ncbi:MAG: O-antigen ligase family protein [Candidatus Latescibacteria bacterium]|nr:O-antigen ligase family protein [Candidatus Latescibacterota bacterium]
MAHGNTRIDSGPQPVATRVVDLAMRTIPMIAMAVVAAFFAAQQAVSPHHRAIKGLVIMGLTALMFRFDMVYSVYLFGVLFAFPSGISIGSSNTVLMTIIPMIWAVRATSSRVPLLRRSPLDLAIGAFLLMHVAALFNVGETALLSQNVIVLWRQLSTCAFFYCIYMFVNDEERLFRFGRIVCVTCTLVMLTAVIELFFPGRAIIPGWIGLADKFGGGSLGYRIEGLRVGGSFESHGMLADFGTQLILFMVYFAVLARNPMEKAFWIAAVGTTFTAIMATANRGATSGLILGFFLALVYFRHRLGATRMALIVIAGVVGLVAVDTVLSEKTIAVSVLDRFSNTRFEGFVPENRTMTWGPTLEEALEKPFFGHGPFFDTGLGLTKRMWPHNGYLFYFFTLGLFGMLAFLWVVAKVFKESRVWRAPGLRDTRLGTFIALSQIWLLVLLVEQMRTDHQRDDIYPYIVWMCFGVIVSGAAIARRRLAEASPQSPSATPASTRSVTSK